MTQEHRDDGMEIMRELIETEKKEAYQKFHGDDFPERFAGLHGGKFNRRPRLMPLLKRPIAAIPVILVVLAGAWMMLRERRDFDYSRINKDKVAALLKDVLSQTHALEKKAAFRQPEREGAMFEESLLTVIYDGYWRKLFPDHIAPSINKALNICLRGEKWGGRPQDQGQVSPAPSVEFIGKEKVRTFLFSEIISKFKEV